MATFYNLARWDKTQRQWGATGGPVWNTTIAQVQSGEETRKSRWARSLGQWELGNRGVLESEYQDLLDFFMAMRGKLYGFRIRDWTDFRDNGRGRLGPTGLASPAIDAYQMFKSRVVPTTGASYQQPITRPVGRSFASDPDLGNTIKLFVNGIEQIQDQESPYTPGTWRVDDTTGIATYTPFQWGFLALTMGAPGQVQVQTTAANTLQVGDWVRVSGLPAPADGFNGVWVVLTIDGPDLFTVASPYNVGDFSGAGANRIIQLGLPLDAPLTWTGEYDKPARFDIDGPIPAQIALINETSSDGSLPPSTVGIQLGTVPVVELRESS